MDKHETTKDDFDIELAELKKKANFSDNPDNQAAINAAIQYLEEKNCPKKDIQGKCIAPENLEGASLAQKADEKKDAPKWGIYTYFYNDGKCDYQTSQSLTEGQDLYRNRTEDTAKLFLANGEIQRQKGDQIDIEICTGKALMDGNLKMKTYNSDFLYVLNHENGTIYNDIIRYQTNRMPEALASFNGFPKTDSTVLVRGTDGLVLKKKGEEQYIGQNLAYLYNDYESMGDRKSVV